MSLRSARRRCLPAHEASWPSSAPGRKFLLTAALLHLPFAAALAAAEDAIPGPNPVWQSRWSAAEPPSGEQAPRLVPFRNGHGLRFTPNRQTRINLGRGEANALRLKGALTLAAIVQLSDVPKAKTPFLSKGRTQPEGRSYELGETRAWCWQQGCMLQWRPGSMSEVLWNDREGDRFVCRILDVHTRKLRTIPHAVYSISPDGRSVVVDSPHGGEGRQLYLIDVRGVVANHPTDQ